MGKKGQKQRVRNATSNNEAFRSHDLEFAIAFEDFIGGYWKRAYERCYRVIREYCDHVQSRCKVVKVTDDDSPDDKGDCTFCGQKVCTSIRTATEMTRWHCLFSFIQFKMIVERINSRMETKKSLILNVIMSMRNARDLIEMNGLSDNPEFSFLRLECLLKAAILYIDYLKDLWSANRLMKQIRKLHPRGCREMQSLDFETEQDESINDYEDKVNLKIVVYYLKRRTTRDSSFLDCIGLM